MYAHQISNLHVPMMIATARSRGLRGLRGAPVTLTTDKQAYNVGDGITYMVRGGTPGAMIAWSSFKDGISTGEYQSAYPNQFIGPDGTLTLTVPAGAWKAGDVGLWEKQVIVLNPDNTQSVGQVFFRVVDPSAAAQSSATTPAATTPAPSTSFFTRPVTIPFINLQVPMYFLLVGGAAALFVFSKR